MEAVDVIWLEQVGNSCDETSQGLQTTVLGSKKTTFRRCLVRYSGPRRGTEVTMKVGEHPTKRDRAQLLSCI